MEVKKRWFKPESDPVPYPSNGRGPLKFITGPVELPEDIIKDPYWQDRLQGELVPCDPPAVEKPKKKPQVKGDEK